LSIDIHVEYAVARPPSAGGPPPLVLVLHGWGQTCQSILKRFRVLRDRGVLLVAPQAPHPLYVRMDPKKVGFSWLTQYERDRAVGEFCAYMGRLLERLRAEERFDETRLFIAGYSQGVSMGYRLAVSGLIQPAGLMAFNSDIPPDVIAVLPAAPKFPVLLVHGEADPLVPRSKSDEAMDVLRAHGFEVARHLHDGAHEIPATAAEAAGDWLVSRLKNSRLRP